MKRTLIIFWLITVLGPSQAIAQEYVFSILPRFFPEKLTAMTTPLVEYLGQELQIPVTLLLTENFASYEMQVASGGVAIGYENPVVYSNIFKYHEVLATARNKDGGKFRGMVIARPDSNIQGLQDLKGKSVMIVGKNSAGGYLSQKLALQEIGFDVKRDCQLVEAADNRQENVIISVSIGDVDAGFIQENAFHVADEFIMPNSIKKVVDTNWLPNWALSVNRSMNEQHKEKIRAAVLNLPADSPVLKAMDIAGFDKASDADYEVMLKLKE